MIMTISVPFEPLSELFRNNPYAELKRMREMGPVYRHSDTLRPVYSFFRAADIRPMANDWRKWSSLRPTELRNQSLGPAGIMMTDDPPFHTEIKSLVLPYFSPAAMTDYESLILSHVDSVLDKCIGAGEINFIRDVAEKISASAICSIAGIPQSDRDRWLDWAHREQRLDGRPVFWTFRDLDAEEEVRTISGELLEYFLPLREGKYFNVKDGVLAAISKSIDDDNHLSGLCALIVGAAISTTANQMTHLLQELVNNPMQMALLRGDRDRFIDPAIEESLRLRGTSRKLTRFVTEDTEIHGTSIARGDAAVLWTASANRDEAVFENPDEFDITRKVNRHMAFGTGIHLCLGNALARLETRILMRRLLERTKSITETRGAGSYEFGPNAMSSFAERYSVELVPFKQ